jgi:GH24 family phage-related lysozyme (muramidase)
LSYIDESLAKLETFEARIPWMYLDTEGYVTAGIGFMLPTPAAACLLPWTKGDRAATPDEITAEFNRVLGLQKGMAPKFYRGDLTLTDAAIDAELLRRLTIVDRALPAVFPKYADLPDSWKLGLLDLSYNMGVHRLKTKFPQFVAAILSGNHQAAEAQCVRPQVGLRRNAWTRQCFSEPLRAA